MTDEALKPCPTPWCRSQKVMTATFFKSKKDDETGEIVSFVECDHSCPVCHVRTPQASKAQALATWNTRDYPSLEEELDGRKLPSVNDIYEVLRGE